MRAAIDEAEEDSIATCEVCSAPGQLADRNGWTSVKCPDHENWSRLDGVFLESNRTARWAMCWCGSDLSPTPPACPRKSQTLRRTGPLEWSERTGANLDVNLGKATERRFCP